MKKFRLTSIIVVSHLSQSEALFGYKFLLFLLLFFIFYFFRRELLEELGVNLPKDAFELLFECTINWYVSHSRLFSLVVEPVDGCFCSLLGSTMLLFVF